MSVKFNFRMSVNAITDPAGQLPVRGGDEYPVTRTNGALSSTYGWETTVVASDNGDEFTDARVKGSNSVGNGSSASDPGKNFRCTLPGGAGQYNVGALFGWEYDMLYGTHIAIFDCNADGSRGAKLFELQKGSFDGYHDITGAEFPQSPKSAAAAAALAANNTVPLTFARGECIVEVGGGSAAVGFTRIAHLSFSQVSVSPAIGLSATRRAASIPVSGAFPALAPVAVTNTGAGSFTNLRVEVVSGNSDNVLAPTLAGGSLTFAAGTGFAAFAETGGQGRRIRLRIVADNAPEQFVWVVLSVRAITFTNVNSTSGTVTLRFPEGAGASVGDAVAVTSSNENIATGSATPLATGTGANVGFLVSTLTATSVSTTTAAAVLTASIGSGDSLVSVEVPVDVGNATASLRPKKGAVVAKPRNSQGVVIAEPPTTPQWTTSNPNVATVDQTGEVTAKGVGSCTIRCAFGPKRGEMTVIVEP
jgi:hypothetical protein